MLWDLWQRGSLKILPLGISHPLCGELLKVAKQALINVIESNNALYSEPKYVGWFSRQNPFEFDINNFKYNSSSLKFWGGTPSVVPYIIAANSINYFAELTAHKVRDHNLAMLTLIHEQLG